MNYTGTNTSVMEALDHAAAQSDKWLFLGALFILAFFAWKVIQWLSSKTEAQQTELRELIKLVTADSKEIAVLLATKAKVIESNSEILRQNSEMLREVKEVISKCATFQRHLLEHPGRESGAA